MEKGEKFVKIEAAHNPYLISLLENVPTFGRFDRNAVVETGKQEYYQSSVRKKGEESSQVFPLFKLRNLLGQSPLEDEILEMVQDKVQAHIDWINDLEKSIKTGEPFMKARDHTQCAFGKWRINYSKENRDLDVNEVLKELDEPHQKIHALADQLLTLAQTDKNQALSILEHEKKTTLQFLLEKLGHLANELISVNKEIVMVIEYVQDKLVKKIGVVIDKVDDILELGKKGVMPSKNDPDFLIENDRPLPILDLKKMIEERSGLKIDE